MVQDAFSSEQDKYITVTQLSNIVKDYVEQSFGTIYLKGEISGFKKASSGHFFFTLKDEASSVSACIWKSAWPSVLASVSGNMQAFQDGVQVLAECRLNVYPRNTSISVVVTKMTPAGLGDLAVKFEMLKKKLADEGLFDAQRKKPLPEYPTTIGIVSANTAAGKGDMVKILNARSPFIKVVIFPTAVQGDAAPPQIIKAINCAVQHYINNTPLKPDVLIIGRGGGAIEDMWCFNDEELARTIANCPIPTITGIGHEQDFTIADFVSDCRASTPSNAAEIATRNTVNLLDTLNACRIRLHGKMTGLLESANMRYGYCSIDKLKRLLNSKFQSGENAFNMAAQSFYSNMNSFIDGKKNAFAMLASKLDTLSPLKILARGYSIVENDEGKVITDSSQVSAGNRINITLNSGKITAEVKQSSRRVSDL